MRVKLKCPNPECATPLALDTDWAGKTGTCSNCQKKFKIPSNLAQLATQSGVTDDKTIDGALSQNASDSVVDAEPIEDAPRPAKKKAGSASSPTRKKAAKKKAVKKKAAKKKSTRKKANRRPVVEEVLEFVDDIDADDGYEDYDDDGYEDYNDAPRGRKGGGRQSPRSRRDDDDDDYYDDDRYSSQSRKRNKRGGSNQLISGYSCDGDRFLCSRRRSSISVSRNIDF